MKLNSYLKIIVSVLVYLIISLPIVFAQELNLRYDEVGNLVTGDGFYREYDGFNHLIRIRQGNTSSGNITEEFIWHPLEERVFIKKVYYNNGTLKDKIKYLNKNTVKIVNSSGTYYETYVYQDDVLVAQVTADGQKQAVHSDHIGSTTLITNSAGNIVENLFYSPYGEQLQTISNSRFTFTGKEFDSVIGHYDFKSRMTKPEWANRPITPDRIFYDFTKYELERLKSYYDPQGLNPYSYARNNPYRFIDKEGNIFAETAATIIALVALQRAIIYASSYIIPYLPPISVAAMRYVFRKAGEAYLGVVTTETPEFKIQEGTYVPPEAIEEICRLSKDACYSSKQNKKDLKPKETDLNAYNANTKTDKDLKKDNFGTKSYNSRGSNSNVDCSQSCTTSCTKNGKCTTTCKTICKLKE